MKTVIEGLLAEYDMIDSAFAKDLRKALAEQPAQQHVSVTDELVGVYCKAWEQSFTADNPYHTVSMTAEDRKHIGAGLKAALAEQPAQQEPVRCPQTIIDAITAYGDARADQDANNAPTTSHERLADCIRLIRKMAEQPTRQEPVAFYRCNGCGYAYEQVHPTSCDCMEGSSFEQVNYYTSPPAQRKPLTNEQFQAICNRLSRQGGWDGDGWDLALKEAIEAAHGIKENT